MPKKVNKPRLTNNQEQWLQEYKKLDTIIKRKRKQGYEIDDTIKPSKPQRITPSSIEKLKGISQYIETNYPTTKPTNTGSPNITNKGSPNITNKGLPKPTNTGSHNITNKGSPNITNKGLPKTTKTVSPNKNKHNKTNSTKNLNIPHENDFIDDEIESYIRKLIPTIHETKVQFKGDRIHGLEMILYLLEHPIDISKEEMYINIHKNSVLVHELLNSIAFDSDPKKYNNSLAELISIIIGGTLTADQSTLLTEYGEQGEP